MSGLGCRDEVDRSNEYDPDSDKYPPVTTIGLTVANLEAIDSEVTVHLRRTDKTPVTEEDCQATKSGARPPDYVCEAELPPGRYPIVVRAGGYVDHEATVALVNTTDCADVRCIGQRHEVDIALARDEARISGTIRLEGYASAPEGVRLRVDSVDGDRSVGDALTESPDPAWDPITGAFSITVPSGTHLLTAEAPGYVPRSRIAQVAAGAILSLGEIKLDDVQAPIAPTLSVVRRLVNSRELEVSVVHPELGVMLYVEATDDQGNAAAARPVPNPARDTPVPVAITLSEADGQQTIVAYAIDRAENRSPEVSTVVELDTTPPVPGDLILAGDATEVRALDVDAELIGSRDVARFGYCVTALDVHGEADCLVDVFEPLYDIIQITLLHEEGPQRVYWAVEDAAGNRAYGLPVDVTLGPFIVRPVPVLDAIEPAAMVARRSTAPELQIIGTDIAPDTRVDLGGQASLACVATTLEGAACPPRHNEPCQCTVRVPDAIRFVPGRYRVRLRTPAPVEDGAGFSNTRELRVTHPPPMLVDLVEPQGFALRPGEATEVAITIEGRDILPSASIRLANRVPTQIEVFPVGDGESPDDVRLVATFDLDGIEPSNETPKTLSIVNPEAEPLRIPFGVVTTTICGVEGTCRLRASRTYPPGLPGHVAMEMTLPADGIADYYTVSGASNWTLIGPDGRTLMGRRTPYGPSRLILPTYMPAGRLIADVPIGSAEPVEVTPGSYDDVPDGCELEEVHDFPGSRGHAITDVDGDGRLDGIFADEQRGVVYTTVLPESPLVVDERPTIVQSGDLDGDGRTDLLFGDALGGVTGYLGAGDGRFPANLILPAPPEMARGGVSDLLVADIDGDRRPEILASYLGPNGGVVQWTVMPDGRIGAPEVLLRQARTSGITTHEMHYPGLPELFITFDEGEDAVTWHWPYERLSSQWNPFQDRGATALGRTASGATQLWFDSAFDVHRVRQLPGGPWTDLDPFPKSVPFSPLRPAVIDSDGGGMVEAVAILDGALNRIDVNAELAVLTERIADLRVDVFDVRLAPGLSIGLVSGGGFYAASDCPDGAPIPSAPGQQTLLEQPILTNDNHRWVDVDGDGSDDLVLVAGRRVRVYDSGGAPVGEVIELGEWDWALLDVVAQLDESPQLTLAALLPTGEGDQHALEVHSMTLDGEVHDVLISSLLPEHVVSVKLLSKTDPITVVARGADDSYVIRPGGMIVLPDDEADPAGERLQLIDGALSGRHLVVLPAPAGRPPHVSLPSLVVRTRFGLAAWADTENGWSVVGTWRPDSTREHAVNWTASDLDSDGFIELVLVTESRGRKIVQVVGQQEDEALFSRVLSRTRSVSMGGSRHLPPLIQVEDLNLDGVRDVLLAAPYAEVRPGMELPIFPPLPEPSAPVAILLGRGDGTLAEPLTAMLCGDTPPPGDAEWHTVTLGTPDLNSDGFPEIHMSAGGWGCARELHRPVQNVLSSIITRDVMQVAPERGVTNIHHAGGSVSSITLVVALDGDAAVVGGSLRSPTGAQVALLPTDSRHRVVSWSSETEGSSLAELLGWHAAGEWTIETHIAGGGAKGQSVELLMGVQWREAYPGRNRACGEVSADGVTVGQPCEFGLGVCRFIGIGVCREGGEIECSLLGGEAPGEPIDEICNAIDDDCDGLVDEDVESLGQRCQGDGVAWCRSAGVRACDDGELVCDTEGSLPHRAESCNGLDDDCDGIADEGIERPLAGLQDGVCDGARQVCAGAEGWYTEYFAIDGFGPEGGIADGLDNDCDGWTDERVEHADDARNCGVPDRVCVGALAQPVACVNAVCQVMCADGASCPLEETCQGGGVCLRHLRPPDIGVGFGAALDTSGDELIITQPGSPEIWRVEREPDGRYFWSRLFFPIQSRDVAVGIGRLAAIDMMAPATLWSFEVALGLELGFPRIHACEDVWQVSVLGDFDAVSCQMAGNTLGVALFEAEGPALDLRLGDAADAFGEGLQLIPTPDGAVGLLAGAPGEDGDADSTPANFNDRAANSGAVWELQRVDGVWQPTAYIKTDDPQPGAHFGRALAAHGDRFVSASKSAPGVYVFERDVDGVWSQQALIPYPEPLDPEDDTAFNVDIRDDRIAFGGAATGAIEVYELDPDDTWVRRHTLPFDGVFEGTNRQLRLTDDAVLAGTTHYDGDLDSTAAEPNENAPGSGVVYMWTLPQPR